MSIDYCVKWKDEKPTEEEVKLVIEDYFNDGVKKIWWKDGTCYVILHGMYKSPFARIVNHIAEQQKFMENRERGLEIFQDDDRTYLSVITRSQDEITNIIAHGLAEAFRRYWKGEMA